MGIERVISTESFQKRKIYEEDHYDIIRPYNVAEEMFDRERFDVEIIKKRNRKLIIIREKNDGGEKRFKIKEKI